MPRTTRDPDPSFLRSLWGTWRGTCSAEDLRILQNILADPPSSAFAGFSAGIYSYLTPRHGKVDVAGSLRQTERGRPCSSQGPIT